LSEKSINTVREAKDYLAARIADEAKREHIPLSEIERKMLYFSETDWTLPGMLEINAEFERDYDSNEFERKIAGLIRNIEAANVNNQDEEETWNQAVDKLAEGDNYLSIMLDPSFTPEGKKARAPRDMLKLWLTALAVVFAAFAIPGLIHRLFGPKFDVWLSDRNNRDILWFCLFGLAALIYRRFGPRISAAADRLFNGRKTGNRA
jgi:hypothetical protein